MPTVVVTGTAVVISAYAMITGGFARMLTRRAFTVAIAAHTTLAAAISVATAMTAAIAAAVATPFTTALGISRANRRNISR